MENNHKDNHNEDVDSARNEHKPRCVPVETYKLLLNEKNRLKKEIDSYSSEAYQSKLVEELTNKNKGLEDKLRELSILNKESDKEIKMLENVILKQEETITLLNKRLENNQKTILKHEDVVHEMNAAIDELKQKIVSIKKYYTEHECKEISNLKNKLLTLENTLEIKESKYSQIEKKHKQLQEKYLKLNSDKRLKPQEELLSQAKEMKANKMDRMLYDSKKFQRKASQNTKLLRQGDKPSCHDSLPIIQSQNMNQNQNHIDIRTSFSFDDDQLRRDDKKLTTSIK